MRIKIDEIKNHATKNSCATFENINVFGFVHKLI